MDADFQYLTIDLLNPQGGGSQLEQSDCVVIIISTQKLPAQGSGGGGAERKIRTKEVYGVVLSGAC